MVISDPIVAAAHGRLVRMPLRAGCGLVCPIHHDAAWLLTGLAAGLIRQDAGIIRNVAAIWRGDAGCPKMSEIVRRLVRTHYLQRPSSPLKLKGRPLQIPGGGHAGSQTSGCRARFVRHARLRPSEPPTSSRTPGSGRNRLSAKREGQPDLQPGANGHTPGTAFVRTLCWRGTHQS